MQGQSQSSALTRLLNIPGSTVSDGALLDLAGLMVLSSGRAASELRDAEKEALRHLAQRLPRGTRSSPKAIAAAVAKYFAKRRVPPALAAALDDSLRQALVGTAASRRPQTTQVSGARSTNRKAGGASVLLFMATEMNKRGGRR